MSRKIQARSKTGFKQRWEINDHANYFGGPVDGMLMTTGFWHMRSKHFPRALASRMTETWATDRKIGFTGDFFPLAMSQQSMKRFASQADRSFGYTPDTAYFVLSGMFRQGLRDTASRLTINHLENYNYDNTWDIPVAPEAYTRTGTKFGDQYSNFNAGKILLFLEGIAGIDISIPNRTLTIREAMPRPWDWMEFRIPIRPPHEDENGDPGETRWTTIRYHRLSSNADDQVSLTVDNCPLSVVIENRQ